MSTTATAEFSSPTTFLNTDPDMKLESGTFTFIDPDTSTDPWECDYFANPTPKEIIHQRVPLHNLRADPHLFTPESSFSLTTNGFTVVKHVSTIQSLTDFKNPENLEGTYFPEIKSLLKSVTGASEVHVINCALRLNHAEPPLRTAAQQAEDPSTQPDKGGLKLDVASMDFSKALIGGIIETQKFGPARVVHIDYSPVGVNKTLRSTHAEISDSPAVQDVIAAEDEAAEKGESYAGRRFGLYSVWRPLKPVRSNPIAVCDPRSINPERDLVEHLNKVWSASSFSPFLPLSPFSF